MTLPENQIVQGDCVQILKTLPSASIDLVVTDPPYLVNYRDRSGRTIKNDSGDGAFLAAFSDAYRVLKPNSFCVSFYGWNRVDEFFSAWAAGGLPASRSYCLAEGLFLKFGLPSVSVSKLICL
jgi:adenine-specific DNA-methyltransferase